jgi:hypothetical protein
LRIDKIQNNGMYYSIDFSCTLQSSVRLNFSRLFRFRYTLDLRDFSSEKQNHPITSDIIPQHFHFAHESIRGFPPHRPAVEVQFYEKPTRQPLIRHRQPHRVNYAGV